MSEFTGVAISTTGDEHRLGFLETSLNHWRRALSLGDSLFVTVDGDDAAVQRVRDVLSRPIPGGGTNYGAVIRVKGSGEKNLGVAANKNTGLEILMESGAQHLFLSDDDAGPLSPAALEAHTRMDVPHTMVCWGRSRRPQVKGDYATWTWPRGVLLYVTRDVVAKVGGMVEAFGAGGHEHAEWSTRIHAHGLTPAPFCSPPVYARSYRAVEALGAAALWHCEDMPRFDGHRKETTTSLAARRRRITSIGNRDWDQINLVMEEMAGHTGFIPYRADENGRASATIAQNLTGRGAEGEKK